MSEVWEQYLNKKPDPKIVLTRDMLRKELGDERKGMLLSVILLLIPVTVILGVLAFIAIKTNLPLFAVGIAFINPITFLRMVICVVLCGCYVVLCVELVKYMIRLYRVRDKGMKIVKATVSNMRIHHVDDAGRRYGPPSLFYLTFPVYGEVCLQDYDYESTGNPMHAGDLYFSTNVGDEYYLLVFERNGDVIKVFPEKHFELSDEVKAWLK